MAIQKGKYFTGLLGGLVLKIVNGQQVVVTKVASGKMKQTEATKAWSGTFGMASAFSSQFKRALGFAPGSYADPGLTNRLNTVMIKILKESRDTQTRLYHFQEDSFSGLTDFNFNIKSPVDKLLLIRPQINFVPGLLEISFPDSDKRPLIRFPKNSVRCKLTFDIVFFRLMDGLVSTNADQQSIIILNDQKEINMDILNFTIPDGCLYVATLFLEYAAAGKNDWRIVNDVNFNPCSILGTKITSGIYQNDNNRLWTEMICFDG